MRQSRTNCKICGQARRPAPTKACRGDSLWSPRAKKFDLDAVMRKILKKIDKNKITRYNKYIYENDK